MKTIENQGGKQVEVLKVLNLKESQQDVKSIEGLFPNEMRTKEIENELGEITKWDKKLWETI